MHNVLFNSREFISGYHNKECFSIQHDLESASFLFHLWSKPTYIFIVLIAFKDGTSAGAGFRKKQDL